jgi:hypothetical protein
VKITEPLTPTSVFSSGRSCAEGLRICLLSAFLWQRITGNQIIPLAARRDPHTNLTDDQKAKLRPVLQDEAHQLRAVHNDTSLSHDQKMAKIEEIREAHKPHGHE